MADMTKEQLEKNLERRKNEWDKTLNAWLEGNWDNPSESDNKFLQTRAEGILERYKNVKKRLLKNPDNLDLAYDIKYFAYQTNAIDRVAKAYDLSSKRIELEENIKDNKDKLSALENAGEGNTAEAQKIKRQLARSRAAVVPAREAQKSFNAKDRNAGKSNAAVEQGNAVPAFDPNTATKTDNFDDPKFTGWATYKSDNGDTVAVWRKNGEVDPQNKGDVYYVLKQGNWYDSTSNKVYTTEAKDKAKQEADPKAAAELKAKQEADAKAAALKKKTGTSGVTPAVTPAVDREAQALDEAAKADFTLPQTLFDNIPSLKLLLEKYVKTPGMTIDAFRKELRDDVWYKQNSQEIKARYVQYYQYRDNQASGQAQGTSDYEMQIAKIEANLKKRAVEIGSAAANDPTAIRKAAENLYITNRSEDENFIDSFLAASIKPVAGKIGGQVTEGYSGEALGNYNKLVEAARDNGFQLSDIIPGGATERQVLQGIASGSIDINRVVADARKLAAQGQPEYVRDLLAQGYTLKQVLAPYRQTMANVLEIQDPEEINLNDPLLRSAISDKGDMNMYEFKKALRRDNRWQYTEQARADVSNAALGVLRDFGFQG
jgi:hypothetical protein